MTVGVRGQFLYISSSINLQNRSLYLNVVLVSSLFYVIKKGTKLEIYGFLNPPGVDVRLGGLFKSSRISN